jgi:gliding motility-associated-like protein
MARFPILRMALSPTRHGLVRAACSWVLCCLSLAVMAQAQPIAYRFEEGCDGVKVFLRDQTGSVSRHWNFGDGTTGTDLAPVHVYPHGVVLDITLTAIAADGTSSVFHLDVASPPAIDISGLSFPTVFTPNGDGINDVFGPLTDGQLGPCSQLSVFNRFGQRLFYGDGYHASWDGRTMAGEAAVEGTYFYTFTIKGLEFTGHLSLFR